MGKEELLKNYADRLSSTGVNRKLYLGYVSGFLDYAGEDFTRATIDRYMNKLRASGKYGDGSINFIFRAIRTMFGRNGIEWPCRRGESPQVREDEVNAPALHPELVKEAIQTVRQQGDPDEQFFLALSTTYGLRRIEMAELTADDINISSHTIHISTHKHGRDRTHLLPGEIEIFLKKYDFSQKMNTSRLFALWYKIENRIELEHVEGVGFYSIRRTLDTLLLDQLPVTVVMSFMRWKQRTSSSMPYRYSAQRFVGREGVTNQVVGEALSVDSKVFAVHPFLKCWSDSDE